MSTTTPDYETLLRDAIRKAKAGAPRVADELRACASEASRAIAIVTDGAAILELASLPTPDGSPPAFHLRLRDARDEGRPTSDLGVYQLSEAGYPIQRWYSLRTWENQPLEGEHRYLNLQELDFHFRWMVSDPSSRLVVLVAFYLQQSDQPRE